MLSPIKIGEGTEITSNQIKVGNIIISSASSRVTVGERVADIRFKMKNKPTKDITVSVLITSEGYR